MSSLSLNSQTVFSKDQLKKCNIILQNLLQNNDSIQFRQPVNWKCYHSLSELTLTDYLIIVKKPMDLGTIKKKLMNSKYRYIEQMLEDIQLVWDNCKLYNAQGQWIYQLAQKLERIFKRLIKNYLPGIIFSNNSSIKKQIQKLNYEKKQQEQQLEQFKQEPVVEELTFKERKEISQKFKLLSRQQLGIVISFIKKQNPEAYKQIEKGKASIIINNMTQQNLIKINQILKKYITN